MLITLYVTELTRANAGLFEQAIKDIPGVKSVDCWNGLARISVADDETITRIINSAKTAGFTASTSISTSVDVPVAGMTCDSCESLLESTIEKKFPGVKARANSAKGIIRLEGATIPNASSLQQAIGVGKYRVESLEEKPSLWVILGAFIAAGSAGYILTRIDAVSRLMNIGETKTFGGSVLLGLFAGSSACMAVAGGIMLTVLGRRPSSSSAGFANKIAPVGSFVAGRVISYTIFGALIGAIGSVLQPPIWVTGALIFVAAVAMIVAGLNMLGIAPRWLRSLMPRLPHSLRQRADSAARSTTAPLLAGAVTFFVPCGFTQALQVYALSSGSATLGASILGGFALGTAPALLVVGWAARAFEGKKALLFMRFAGAAVVLLGLANIQNAAAVAGMPLDFKSWRQVNGVAAVTQNEPLPPLVNGIQIISMTSGDSAEGYSPNHFTVRAGIPVEWHVKQQAVAGCLSSLVSRKLNVESTLIKGENIVKFTAPEPGTYGFSCGMGMYSGNIVAVKS